MKTGDCSWSGPCGGCNVELENTHHGCPKCDAAMHAFCGHGVEALVEGINEGYGQPRLCSHCYQKGKHSEGDSSEVEILTGSDAMSAAKRAPRARGTSARGFARVGTCVSFCIGQGSMFISISVKKLSASGIKYLI
jgi:hypothetical protein